MSTVPPNGAGTACSIFIASRIMSSCPCGNGETVEIMKPKSQGEGGGERGRTRQRGVSFVAAVVERVDKVVGFCCTRQGLVASDFISTNDKILGEANWGGKEMRGKR